jgi:hypothetical protein
VPFSFAPNSVFAWFKAAIFMLLAWNTAVFVYGGTFSEGLDSIAWLVLLALFELETGAAQASGKHAAAIHAARLAAATAIPVAAVGYFLDREWLDAINSVLWIAVVAILEFQVRFAAAARYRALTTTVAGSLYCGLGAIAVVWLWRADWFSAYDALVWLLAFVTIEINVLQVLQRRSATPRVAASTF